MSVILLCYRITCLCFCNKKWGALFVPDPAYLKWVGVAVCELYLNKVMLNKNWRQCEYQLATGRETF